MSIPTHYETNYQWEGNGSERGTLSISGRSPLPVGSPNDEERYSPEHLLLAAAEVCLLNTFIFIAEKSRLDIKDYHSTAEGELEFVAKQGYHFKKIIIRPVVTAAENIIERVERTLERAHKACLISRSLDCEVVIEPEFRTE